MYTINDLNVWTNKGQACEVSVEIQDVTAVFVMWDWYDYEEEKRQFALQQLCTILNLGGTFDEIERHMRKNGIDCELKELQLDVIVSVNNEELTYDVVFNDDETTNAKGMLATKEEAIYYVQHYNGTNESYFADYKGGVVQVVCNETGDVVYEETVR